MRKSRTISGDDLRRHRRLLACEGREERVVRKDVDRSRNPGGCLVQQRRGFTREDSRGDAARCTDSARQVNQRLV
jgi:hypothetical protein